MPRASVIGLSRLAGAVAMALPLREKRYGLENLDAVFGDTKSDREKHVILRSSFATFTLTMLDVFWFSKNPEKRIHKYVQVEDSANKDSFFEDKAIICITAHLGSWEILGQTASLMGADLASIAATIKNPNVNRLLIERREKTGQTIIAQKGALKTLISRFRKKGKAAFVLDQRTPEDKGGVIVDFLGLPMPVSSAPAALAYRTGTEIYLGFCIPQQGGHYKVILPKVIAPPEFSKERDADQTAIELTQQIQNEISKIILQYPQFWLWAYKHWRRVEGQTYPDNYPTY